ncbi:hypothetical protein [Streptomyces sp. NPDC008150]|uniref:hypothetical protein n=1 Tax=Streptomyces sp. NPDC008150 TaxID=3364816 RepID=UPI0036EA68E1
MTKTPPDWHRAVIERSRIEASAVPSATVRAVEFTVNCVPGDDLDQHLFELRVQYRGNDRYAVIRGGDMCLGVDGTWDYGVKEYDRGDAWLNAHRFDLDTALRLAREHAPLVTVNGHTVTDAITARRNRSV